MRARRVAVAGVVALALLSGEAQGDVNLRMRSPSTCKTDGGSELRLPAGYFMDEPTRDKVDAEVRRLQDAETRLTAENRSMRATVAGWQPGIYVLATALVVGIAGGVYVGLKL